MTRLHVRKKATRQWLADQPLPAFPLIYIGWAYVFWIPVVLSDSSAWSFPNLLWFLLGGASPRVAGVGLAALNGGGIRIADLWKRLVDWRRIRLKWWLPMIVCHTLMLMHIYNLTGRSILAVVIFHGMMNFTGEWLRISPAMYPFMLTGNMLVALIVVWWWRGYRRTG